MKVSVLGSGSRGNAMALTADGVTLLLDAGFPLRTLRRRARTAGVDLATLVGIVVTHEHGDHACGARLLASRTDCPILGSRGTLQELASELAPEGIETMTIAHLETVTIGPFEITGCQIMHDAVEPLALAVTGPDGERVVLAYDFGRATAALKYLLRTADCLIMESNHDESMLRSSPYPPSVRRRIGGPDGHLSNRAAAQLMAEACHSTLQTVVLAHISEVCNQPALAQGVAHESLAGRRFQGQLFVAEQDQALDEIQVEP